MVMALRPGFNRLVNVALAIILAGALTTLLGRGACLTCPHAETDAPCCPKSQPQKTHCPVAPSVKICIYSVSEAKIGIAEAKVKVAAPVAALPAPVGSPMTPGVLDSPEFRPPTRLDLYLIHRVLLI
jgi:hypothetical protein